MFDIAIIGGGFSGAMVAINLVRHARQPFSLILFEPASEVGPGAAYSTPSPLHLLNVRASKMGAFPDDEAHFFRWLKSAEAQAVAARHRLPSVWHEDDFVPRLLYGAYIKSMWNAMLPQAREKQIRVEIRHQAVTAITPKEEAFMIASDGDVSVKHLVLATGNQFPQPPSASENRIYNVFHYDFDALCLREKNRDLPVAIIGTGLTAVDTFLSLKAVGWDKKIILLSRRALLPAIHEKYQPYSGKLEQRGLLGLMRELRRAAEAWEAEGGSWQAVVDSLRPRMQELWQGFPLREKKLFFRRLFTFWNVHRHRMAPEIGVPLHDAIGRGEVVLRQGNIRNVIEREGKAEIAFSHDNEITYEQVAAAFYCIGPDYRAITASPMLEKLLQARLIEPSETGYGILVNESLRAYADENKTIHAIGNYVLGELLETTAVPELRREAVMISRSLLNEIK